MKSLFDKTQFAGMTMKNRFIRSATFDGVAARNGHQTEKLLQVYEELAKGGAATIITGLTYVTDKEQPYPGQMGIYDDTFIEEYKQLTNMCHKYNSNIILQLACLGSQTSVKEGSDKVIWGASAVADLSFKSTPKEMSVEEISYVQDAFAAAAERAKQAGFDGVQIHGAHGYLLNKFLTPYYNRRTDAYGGSIENRSRMILETYQAIRNRVGKDYPVLLKINSQDYMDQGMTFDDCKYVCEKISELGIDAIEISGGSRSSRPNEGYARKIPPEQDSYYKAYASEIAAKATIPVILVGGNRDLNVLSELINETKIEYIALSRPLICEPDLINRWQRGDLNRAKCISCGKCFHPTGTSCVFNRQATSEN